MDRSTARRLLVAIVVIAGLVLVGVYAYNAGVTAGLAEGGRVLGPGDRVASPYIYPGFGFGFGFFGFFGALLFFLLIFGLLRAVFWGGHRGPWQGGGRWRDGSGPWAAGAPPMFEEWHRRMHEGSETGEVPGGQGSSDPPSSAPPRA
jgi:hypothetical protein